MSVRRIRPNLEGHRPAKSGEFCADVTGLEVGLDMGIRDPNGKVVNVTAQLDG